MFLVNSYSTAVWFLLITMLCWGSWANTQKLASKKWAFQHFYWDYAIGMVLFSLIMAFTLGSLGSQGRRFIPDLIQADSGALASALIGGVVFNFANILFVIAIEIAGLAVAFPVGIGLALVIGVLVNYFATPAGNPWILFSGVSLVCIAIGLDALAYRQLPVSASRQKLTQGLLFSVFAGIAMGFFYRFVASAMAPDFAHPAAGQLTPYTAFVIFSLGIFASNFLFNTLMMYKPVIGQKATFSEYLQKGTPQLHLIGMLGGAIWGLGMLFSIVSADKASYAVAYGLGQGATMVSAAWGVFVWKEFKQASNPRLTQTLLSLMFLFFLCGLALIILARTESVTP